LRGLATRTGLEDVRGLVSLLTQTLRFGTGISEALRVYSEDFRDRRMQRAEEAAAKIGTKLIFPLVLCLFPSFSSWRSGRRSSSSWRHSVGSKALGILATIPLIVQLVSCASTPAQTSVQAQKAVTQPEKKKSTSPVAQESKGFAEDVALGDAAWQAQDLDRAIYYYVQAMGKSPHDAATLAKMGAIEDGRGNAALAETAFEMAHTANPKEPRIAERLARLYLQRGNVDGAAQIYTQVLALDSHRTRALDGMGEAYLARSDYVQSIGYFDRALAAEKPDTSAVPDPPWSCEVAPE